ncbi:MAG: hypothetical protein PHP45_06250 [Elusimicrobiales bacterium]|nr:hypothetical protein [Elusimicrobiales bacterium]
MKKVILPSCALLLALAGWWILRARPSKIVSEQASLPSLPTVTRAAPPETVQPPAKAAMPAPAADTPPPPRAPGKPAAKANQSETAYSAGAAAKIRLLDEILQSKNDNDPRLDSAFNNLSPETKKLFRQKYAQLPAEGLNERGTIVYLLGKNLADEEDWAFLRAAAGAPPCLSLADCAQPAPPDDSHRALGVEITLSYPALVALAQAEKVLAAHKAGKPVKNEALAVGQAMEVVRAAKASRSAVVAEKAARLEQRF